MDAIPPRPGTGHIRCERVPAGGTLTLTILSPRLLLVPYHPVSRKNLLCPHYLGHRCRLCREGDTPLRERWAEALWHEPRRVVVQCFTEGAVRHCPDLLRWVDNARGLVVELSRLRGAYGGVKAKVIARRDQPHHRTPAAVCEVHDKLMSMYRVNMSDLTGSVPLLDNTDIESPAIPNVSEERRPPPRPRPAAPSADRPPLAVFDPNAITFGVPIPEPGEEGDGGDDQLGPLGGYPHEPPGPRDLTPEEIRDRLRKAASRDPHGNNGAAM